MTPLQLLRGTVAAVFLCLSSLGAAITLVPVVPSGLTSPIFAGNAGDNSNRLFIVEQGGIIRVLQPGASTPTQFLDISSKVLAGGERGLLGLAFHPQYSSTGRFFGYYTRAGDGAITVAEYGASPSAANTAGTSETVLLTIDHSAAANHNGGMLAFGPDGFLYIGVGDGGSGNDPPNNAQNTNVLLGKILRIDVDNSDVVAGTKYSAPVDNPYVGIAGRDEIFSIGWRNPWRFSFDRAPPHAQWVADVGQGAREEVDTPVVRGGNYGWRVYEGSQCSGTDAALCTTPPDPVYIPPLFDYGHSGGRCSITGGYVYRGAQGAFPAGTYVFGDYCTGEIFAWNGATQTLLLDTALNISSFGEDEQGELYVIGLGGTLSRIVGDTPCSYAIAPTSQSVPAGGGAGTVGVTTTSGCGWTAESNASWLHITVGASGNGSGSTGFSADANTSSTGRTGTLTIAGKTFTVTQAGAAACVFSISPASATYPRSGGSGVVAIAAPTGCAWIAVSRDAWISILGASAGSGDGRVSYSVAAYTGKPKKRQGMLTVAGKTFTVTQSK